MSGQGRAASSSYASSSSRASWPLTVDNIIPTGIPAADSASGSEIAGSPVAFWSGVNATQSMSRSITCS